MLLLGKLQLDNRNGGYLVKLKYRHACYYKIYYIFGLYECLPALY
jgi:hypothetical protein